MSKNYMRKNKIAGQFSARTIAMMESPAFRVLSLSAHRALARLEIEHAHHGGNDNGQLPVTYDQFVEYGIHRNAVSPAIREIEALGFVEITERGRAGNAEWRRPNKFRLTYRPVGRAGATDEWRNIKTTEEAEVLAECARKASRQKHFPVSVNDNFHSRNRYRKGSFHTPETDTTEHTPETDTTSISRDLCQAYQRKAAGTTPSAPTHEPPASTAPPCTAAVSMGGCDGSGPGSALAPSRVGPVSQPASRCSFLAE